VKGEAPRLFELARIVPARRDPIDRTALLAFSGRGASGRIDPEVSAAVESVAQRPGWRATEEQVAEAGTSERIVQVWGAGEHDAFDGRKLGRWVVRALEAARVAGAPRIRLLLPDHEAARGEVAAERVAREALLAGYSFDRYRAESAGARVREIELAPPPGREPGFARAVARAEAVAAGVVLARDLGNAPPNEANPEWMVARSRELARRIGAKIRVLGPADLARRGMGGLLAVGAGSKHPPRLVRIEVGEGPKTVALVGKGVTFDTGGISIKPAAQMEEMKWDKCGACTVLGIAEATSRMRLPLRLRLYLPLAENMPDGSAYRPGDIVRCGNGKSVEIVNTDAEGRMILADALSWASAEDPDDLVELSTLTGACAVALGLSGAGLFTPDRKLADELLGAAERTGERLWRLPLWPEFAEEMRGTHSDLKNSGGRWGGASTAAAFLSNFVSPVARWAHLDIAGPAYVGTPEAGRVRGATGYGVALVVDWLRELASRRSRR
jgi:leucyl aminopeptidase